MLSLEMELLAKEKVLVIGLGEVGRALFELLRERQDFTVYGLDIDEAKTREVGQKQEAIPTEVNVMHACIPCISQKKFIGIIANYAMQFNPKLVIVNSTVPPGTTMALSKLCTCLVAHSPIRGVHKDLDHMKWEVKRWTKYVGGASPEASDAARKHFEKMGLKTKVLQSCVETELAKLFETTYRAWMIACFQEMHRISRHFEADFDDIVDFIEDTHRVGSDRPVMFPGVIGGHCVIPNTKLLLESFDSDFLRLILESNEKRQEEIKDRNIQDEAEKIKKRIERSKEK
jgi:UDP-N-acetyl-D-mannosaminuronate dehydrogenase